MDANNKELGGLHMFKTKSATRRTALLANSSLVAAALTAFTMLMAPDVAAAANECGDPATNGTAADTFTCAGVIPSITYPTTSGNLTLRLQGTLRTSSVSVTPTGANTVTINLTPTDPVPGDMQIVNSSGAAINVDRGAAGAISVSFGDDFSDFATTLIDGSTAGVRTRNTGTGVTTINLSGTVTGPNLVTSTAGVGIDAATNGSGAITISNAWTISGATAAIAVSAGANVTIGQTLAGLIDGRILLNNTGVTIVNLGGDWKFSGVSTLRSAAASALATTFNNGGTNSGKTVVYGAASEINFGQSVGTFNNTSYLITGADAGASTFTLRGVDAWNNSGRVNFGMGDGIDTDGETNDRVVLVNDTTATFTATGFSMLAMDVDFSASQATCAAAVTADCLDLRGHNTTGATAVVVNPVTQTLTAERIVLVDASGAGTDAAVFHISDQSPGYRAFGDGMIDTGFFLYEITHDTVAKQHVLTVSGVDEEAVELNLSARTALSVWETATGTWFDRQADLRAASRAGVAGVSPGAWLRVVGTYANQTLIRSLVIGGDAVDVVASNNQDTVALVGGVDLLGSTDGSSVWVAGVTFGQAQSDLGFKQSPNQLDMQGLTLGAYASLAGEGFFVDAVVNATSLDTTYVSQGVGMELEGEARSVGYQLEGGLRMALGDGIHLEPLAALSYVTTDLDTIAIATGVAARFDTATSFRGSLGARLSGDVEVGGLSLQLAGTGRLWKEIDGEAASAITTPFGDFDFLDSGDAATGEVGVSLGVFGMDGRLSAQLSSGVMFRQDYQSVDVSFGARYQW